VKITFIELEFHTDSLSGLIDIFSLAHFDITINIITRESTFDILKDSLLDNTYIQYYVFKDTQSHLSCLKKSRELINGSDFIIINTLSQKFGSFTSLFHKKILLRVHDANKQFCPRYDFGIRQFKNLLKFFLKEMLWYNFYKNKKRINRETKLFLFSEPELLDYAIQSNYVTEVNSAVLPLKVNSGKSINVPNMLDTSSFKIAIIGSISSNTRDVRLLSDLIFHLSDQKLPCKFIFKFLGDINTKDGLKLCNHLNEINNPLLHFEFHQKLLNQNELISELNKTHCILIPLKITSTIGIFKEYYGLTKTSGNISDIVYAPQPVILPCDYHSLGNHEAFIGFKDFLEISEIFLELAVDRELLLKKSILAQNFAEERYGLKRIQEYLFEIFTKI
jgi:hypothetical protein